MSSEETPPGCAEPDLRTRGWQSLVRAWRNILSVQAAQDHLPTGPGPLLMATCLWTMDVLRCTGCNCNPTTRHPPPVASQLDSGLSSGLLNSPCTKQRALRTQNQTLQGLSDDPAIKSKSPAKALSTQTYLLLTPPALEHTQLFLASRSLVTLKAGAGLPLLLENRIQPCPGVHPSPHNCAPQGWGLLAEIISVIPPPAHDWLRHGHAL